MQSFWTQIATMVITTALGTIVGGLITAVRSKAFKLAEKTEQEHIERKQNREMLGKLLFYRLEDLHKHFVIDGYPCSAADKQQVDDIYRHYHDELGLNGPGTHMYNEIMEAHQEA